MNNELEVVDLEKYKIKPFIKNQLIDFYSIYFLNLEGTKLYLHKKNFIKYRLDQDLVDGITNDSSFIDNSIDRNINEIDEIFDFIRTYDSAFFLPLFEETELFFIFSIPINIEKYQLIDLQLMNHCENFIDYLNDINKIYINFNLDSFFINDNKIIFIGYEYYTLGHVLVNGIYKRMQEPIIKQKDTIIKIPKKSKVFDLFK